MTKFLMLPLILISLVGCAESADPPTVPNNMGMSPHYYIELETKIAALDEQIGLLLEIIRINTGTIRIILDAQALRDRPAGGSPQDEDIQL